MVTGLRCLQVGGQHRQTVFAGVAERDVYLPEHARRVTANIYDFNTQSRKMFLSLDFQQTGKEWYVLDL